VETIEHKIKRLDITPTSNDRVRNLISQRMLHPDARLILNTQSESCFRHLFFEAQIATQQQLRSRGRNRIQPSD